MPSGLLEQLKGDDLAMTQYDTRPLDPDKVTNVGTCHVLFFLFSRLDVEDYVLQQSIFRVPVGACAWKVLY